VIVIEAPISSGYSAQVLAEAGKRFPGILIKCVITTSDSWPHIGGLREYAAQGIPLYVLDKNVPIVERLLPARHSRHPDSLEKKPEQERLVPVARQTIVGSGTNRIELYPLRGETSERQMIAYFPGLKMLYGSDAFQRDQEGKYFLPQTVSEVADAVAREHLEVEKFWMMHMGLTSWSEVVEELDRAQKPAE